MGEGGRVGECGRERVGGWQVGRKRVGEGWRVGEGGRERVGEDDTGSEREVSIQCAGSTPILSLAPSLVAAGCKVNHLTLCVKSLILLSVKSLIGVRPAPSGRYRSSLRAAASNPARLSYETLGDWTSRLDVAQNQNFPTSFFKTEPSCPVPST